MSLFDEAGNVYRLLGKAEDVTGRRAAAEHFRQLAAGTAGRPGPVWPPPGWI